MRRRKSSKNLISPPPYEPEVKVKARTMFLDGMTMEKVAEAMGIPVGTLVSWSRAEEVSWLTARQERDRSLLEDAFSKRKLVASKVTSASLDQLNRAVDAIAQRAVPPSPAEAEKIANVYNILEKSTRLDLGKSTENVNVAAKVRLSLDDIKKVLQEHDPLMSEE